MWTKQRNPDLAYKGAVGADAKRVRIAGGRDVPNIVIVSSNNDQIDLWFEVVKDPSAGYDQHRKIDFKKLPGFVQVGELNQFDMDAFVHASDGQLKIAIMHWRGDADNIRDIYVLRTGYYWVEE